MALAATVIADTRYTFVAQFLCENAIFACRVADVERQNPNNPVEMTRPNNAAS
jgi:hypothetical protein